MFEVTIIGIGIIQKQGYIFVIVHYKHIYSLQGGKVVLGRGGWFLHCKRFLIEDRRPHRLVSGNMVGYIIEFVLKRIGFLIHLIGLLLQN